MLFFSALYCLRKQTRFSRQLVVIVVASCLCTSCTQSRDQTVAAPEPQTAERTSQQQQPTFGITSTITPATIDDYVNQSNIARTQQIEFFDPQLKKTRTITDTQVINQIIGLMLDPPTQMEQRVRGPERSFLITLRIPSEGGEQSVHMNFDPQKNEITLVNIGNSAQPLQISGTYPVTPAFGATLFKLLSISFSTFLVSLNDAF